MIDQIFGRTIIEDVRNKSVKHEKIIQSALDREGNSLNEFIYRSQYKFKNYTRDGITLVNCKPDALVFDMNINKYVIIETKIKNHTTLEGSFKQTFCYGLYDKFISTYLICNEEKYYIIYYDENKEIIDNYHQFILPELELWTPNLIGGNERIVFDFSDLTYYSFSVTESLNLKLMLNKIRNHYEQFYLYLKEIFR